MYTGRIESCARRISKALELRGMKQTELCKLAKIPKSSLSIYISGDYEPKQDRLYDMAKVLDVDPVWLMGYDVPMEREKKTPDKSKLSEGEALWLKLYHQLTSETREVFIKMINSFDNIPTEKQEFLLGAIRIALENQK